MADKMVERLRRVLDDDEFHGENKIRSMGADAIEPLTTILEDPETPRMIRQRALYLLGVIGETQAFDTVAHYLADADPTLRIAATRAITHLDSERAAGLLAESLEDDDPSASNVKMSCLAETGHKCAKGALTKFRRQTGDTFLKSAASRSLKRLKEVQDK